MNRSELLDFMRIQKWAVEASVSSGRALQGALVGFATTDSLELIFDTSESTRKIANLKSNSSIALVAGGWVDGDERTVQYESVADLPSGQELDSKEQPEELIVSLGRSGEIFMPAGAYGFSTYFPWRQDRFGISWRLNLPGRSAPLTALTRLSVLSYKNLSGR